jgi:hypothetical protein
LGKPVSVSVDDFRESTDNQCTITCPHNGTANIPPHRMGSLAAAIAVSPTMAIRTALTTAVATPVPSVSTRKGCGVEEGDVTRQPRKGHGADHRGARVGFRENSRRDTRITRNRKHL